MILKEGVRKLRKKFIIERRKEKKKNAQEENEK